MERRLAINAREMPYAACGGAIEYPQGIKWTKQRKSVYRVLWETSEPLNATQIYNLAARDMAGEEYAVSTIYRILTMFEEKGLVEKTTWMGDGTAVYTLNRGGHTHYAVCLECRRRIPLRGCPFSHMQLDAGEFTVTGHKLEVYGYCGECRGKSGESIDYVKGID